MLRKCIALAIALGFAGGALAAENNSSSGTVLNVQASQQQTDGADTASLASAMHLLASQQHALASQQASVLAELSKVSAGLGKLSAQQNDTNVALSAFAAQQASVNAFLINAHNKLFSFTNDSLASLRESAAQQATHNAAAAANITELLASGFTLSSAAVVKNCARSSVFFIEHVDTCSAFAYRSGPVGARGTILVSAAHCFLNEAGQAKSSSAAVTARSLAMPPMACTLLATFGKPSDAALLHCPGAAGTLPLRRRAGAATFFLPAATAGFAEDTLVASEYSLPQTRVSLNIRPSYVGTTLGAGRPAHSTSSHGTNSLGYRVAGVVEQGTVFGKSGGPVLDASCGVLGVNHVSLQSSGFAGLDEVDNHMSEMAKNSTDWAAS